MHVARSVRKPGHRRVNPDTQKGGCGTHATYECICMLSCLTLAALVLPRVCGKNSNHCVQCCTSPACLLAVERLAADLHALQHGSALQLTDGACMK